MPLSRITNKFPSGVGQAMQTICVSKLETVDTPKGTNLHAHREFRASPPLCDIPSGCCSFTGPVLPFACCVGSLRSVGRCGRCSCWCRFRVRGAQSLVCWGCAECGGMCRLRVSGAQ